MHASYKPLSSTIEQTALESALREFYRSGSVSTAFDTLDAEIRAGFALIGVYVDGHVPDAAFKSFLAGLAVNATFRHDAHKRLPDVRFCATCDFMREVINHAHDTQLATLEAAEACEA